MTSAHSMQPRDHSRGARRAGNSRFTLMIVLISLSVAMMGCETKEKVTPPMALHSPYGREVLWAIAPLANESGVSTVDGARVADRFVEEAQQIQGVNVVPVNRVILAMRQLDMPRVATPGDAMALMRTLGVDSLVVGTITAYDPYPPITLGAAVQLYTREPQEQGAIDPVAVSRAPTERAAPAVIGQPLPVAQAAGVFEATHHQTLAWLNEYAAGRAPPNSAYGKDVYLVDMEMYTQFVAHRLLHDLLLDEQARLTPLSEPEKAQEQPKR